MATVLVFPETSFNRRPGGQRHEFTGVIPDGLRDFVLRVAVGKWADGTARCEAGIDMSFDGGLTWPYLIIASVDQGGDTRRNKAPAPELTFWRTGLPLATGRMYRVWVKPLDRTITLGPGTVETVEGVDPVLSEHNSIAFDAASSVGRGGVGGFTSVTWSHTVGAIADGALSVNNSWFGTATVSGVTFNGDALTKIGSDIVHGSFNLKASQFYMVAPDAGAFNIVVTLSASTNEFVGGGVSLSGVAQTSTIGTQVRTSGSGTTATANVTTVGTDWVVDVVSRLGSGSVTPGAGQTERWDLEAGVGTAIFGAGSTEPASGATSVAMTHTFSSQDWVQCATPFHEAAAAPGGDAVPPAWAQYRRRRAA